MSNVKDIGRKIHSLKNTQKVTRAMNLISSIKLKKYLPTQYPSDRFFKETEKIRRQMSASLGETKHPVVEGYPEVKKTHIILFSADKGLCGTHNSTIFKSADVFYDKLNKKGIAAEFTCLGNKAVTHARHEEWEVVRSFQMNEKALTPEVIDQIVSDIYGRFLASEIQDVWVIGKVFRSTLVQETILKQILPLPSNKDIKNAPGPIECEPSGDSLALTYGKIYLRDLLRVLIVNAYLSEHSSRLTAMENATRNSEDMINKYISIQNHARQAAVTNELIEIVSGKEALKG